MIDNDDNTQHKNPIDSVPIQNWKKSIVLFLSSQILSLFGSSLVQYAITWYITINTQSGVMMTIAIICGFLPTFFLSPFAGVWADRYNRKLLIMLSDTFIAVSTLVLAVLFLMGYQATWLLFVTMSLRAVGSSIQSPAVSAMLPQIVPQDKLTKVSGANSSIQSIVMLISPMLSGALLAMASIEIIFFIDVVTAAIAVLILFFFLRVPLHAKAMEKQTTGYLSDLKIGLKYIRKHDYVRKFFLFCAFFFFLAAPVCFLSPLQATRTFGNDVWRLTALEIAFSIGMIAGGITMATWGGLKNKVKTMAFASLIIAAFTTALGLTPIFWIYLIFMGFIGISMPFFNTPATVLLQEKVEPDFLGRVFGVLNMISSAVMPLGMLVFGPLADVIRIEWMLIGTGIAMFIVGILLFRNKVLIDAGKPIETADG